MDSQVLTATNEGVRPLTPFYRRRLRQSGAEELVQGHTASIGQSLAADQGVRWKRSDPSFHVLPLTF